jgi:phage repressor protein C with HTH and peptisase S24 domain
MENSYSPIKESMDMVRKLILDRLAEKGLSMKDASLKMGRAHSYLYQFLKKGLPNELHERDRISLAEIIDVPADELRGPSTLQPKRSYVKTVTAPKSYVDPAAHSPLSRQSVVAPHHQREQFIPGAELYANMDLPVYGTAQGGDGALVITDRPVDYVARPSVLLRVLDAYGTIVDGDSMFPALRPGATALVNPHLPPRVEDICIFRKQGEDGTVHVIIKEYRGQTDTHWKVRQYNPAKDFLLKKTDWQTVHRTVGNYFP